MESSDRFRIRPFKKEDRFVLADIYFFCRVKSFTWLKADTFNLSDFEVDTEGEIILVLEEVNKNKVIGFAGVWAQDNFLHHLYIIEDYQGQSLGKRLLDECLNSVLKRPARLKCLAENKKAQQFYQKLGWEIIESHNLNDGMSYHTYCLNGISPK